MTPETIQVNAGAQRATAREFLAVMFRRRWLILALFAVTLGTVLAMAFGNPRMYVSSGQVLVRRGQPKSVMDPTLQVTSEWDIDLGSEVQTAKSGFVVQLAQQILDRERGGRPALKLSADRVAAEVSGKTNLMVIGYTDADPRVAERGCDALLRAYVEYRQSAVLAYPRRFFDEEIARAGAELERWQEKRRDFSRETGMVDLSAQRSQLIELLANLERARAEASQVYAEAKAQYVLMGQLLQNPDVDIPSLLQSYPDNSITDIKGAVTKQQSHVAQLRERFQDDSPEVVDARATLDSLRTMMQREANGRYAISRSRVEVARAKLDVVEQEIAKATAHLGQMGDLEIQSAEVENQITNWKARYLDFTRSSSQALVTENTSRTISVLLLDPAGPARLKNTTDYVRLGLAPAFSLVVGVGLAFFVDGLDLTVHTPGHAEEETHLPVLAAISERKRRHGRPAEPEKDAA
jgi:polysaccharide biosynthesis transport protein